MARPPKLLTAAQMDRIVELKERIEDPMGWIRIARQLNEDAGVYDLPPKRRSSVEVSRTLVRNAYLRHKTEPSQNPHCPTYWQSRHKKPFPVEERLTEPQMGAHP